ncbi:hypothetical protein DRN46_02765 [Thermococci archaeon]|nr:MAG: hypothetical protein DRN46_02765 [Thermococci archaeon]RLF93453.1 MAG: hypothetical protein DRN52_06460 [Thermococci archaeon]
MRRRIVHISDTHITPLGRFLSDVYDAMVEKINEERADLIIHSGDVTDYGFLQEYKLARDRLAEFELEPLVIPGNHDYRNLGHTLYPEFIGETHTVMEVEDLGIIAIDTSVPDLNEGRLGRTGQTHLMSGLREFQELIKVVVLHHHLVPVPEAGRERNLIDDAGDVLKIICENGADLVLCGHRHVPNAIKVENTVIVNAGTLSSVKTRGYHGNSYNLLEITEKRIRVKVIRYLDGNFDVEMEKEYKRMDSP